jgi:hypothetical protein
MNLGAIVEVVIGIIFVWIVLSLTTIQFQEWISTRLDKRARDMELAIHEMLANPNLKAQLYDHPLIRGLTAKKRRKPSEIPLWYYRYPILRGFTKEKRKIPAYIPSQQFALTLFDLALTAGTESSIIQQGVLKIRDDLENENKLTVYEAVIEELNLLAEFARSAAGTEARTAITRRTLESLKSEAEQFIEKFRAKYPKLKLEKELEEKIRKDLADTLQEASNRKQEIDQLLVKQPPNTSGNTLSKIRRGAAAMSVISPEFNQTLNALLQNVEEYVTDKETELAKARGNVEKWFDDSMDRVSGTYKRYSQALALWIGLIIALLLNVDSINLTLYLWREPSVRQALAAQASNFELPEGELQANPEEALQKFREQFVGLSLPVGWVINESQGAAYLDANCRLFPGLNEAFGIPVSASVKCIAPPQSNNQTNLALKLIGILITALAARQGAPFWFDILKRVVNLRGTGANPAEKEGK